MNQQVKRQATQDEIEMLKDLRGVTFAVGSFDKRFVRDVADYAINGGELTDRQAALIPTLHYRYRSQHGKQTPNYDPKNDPKAQRVCHCKLPGFDANNRSTCPTCGKPHRSETLAAMFAASHA